MLLAAIHATVSQPFSDFYHVLIDRALKIADSPWAIGAAATPHATPHVIVDQVTNPLRVADSRWAIFAAFAAAAAALATGILAYITRNLAHATSAMATSTKTLAEETASLGKQTANATLQNISNENANYKSTTTIGIINQYSQVTVPMTETIALTAYAAASQITTFANDLPELRRLRGLYSAHSSSDQDEQYRVIVLSVTVIVNFYMNALQLLRRDLLNVPLFMNTFAKTFLAVIGALRTVNAETKAMPDANVNRLNDFEQMCKDWRERDPDSQASSKSDTPISSEPSTASNPDPQS